jgi:hypothetical protein
MGVARTDVDALLDELGVSATDCAALLASVTEAAGTLSPVIALKQRLRDSGVIADSCEVERALLVRAASVARPRIADLPVAPEVKTLMIAEFDHLMAVSPALLPQLAVGHSTFVALCKIVTLRRFVAGQLHWERSGIPRSWVAKAVRRGSFAMVATVALELGGLAPIAFAHLAWRRGLVLRERDHLRAYHRIARSMRIQTDLRAFVAESWFHSPETHRVSPHLAWLNTAIVENGGSVTVLGPAHPDSGVFTGGLERRRLYDRGEFVPTTAVAIWPRRAMLAWADRHPELAT